MYRTTTEGLRSINVGNRDCLAMDIVGGSESISFTPRSNKYSLTFVDCFSRYAFAIFILGQSSKTVITAVIGNYIAVYNTPRTILTDESKYFESILINSCCYIFCIHNICISGYRPQCNNIFIRFNLSVKHSLRKLLSKAQQEICI